MRSTVSEKGQITVPKPLRERLGIRAGDQLELTEEQGSLIVRKAIVDDPLTSVYGVLNRHESTDEVIRTLRGAPDAV